MSINSVVVLLCVFSFTYAFHDCIQPRKDFNTRRFMETQDGATAAQPGTCSGGLCVGMHNGPHEGGPASYPVGDDKRGYTTVYSTMTVPEPPKEISGITYYIWTDIFFGDMSLGRMNQFVPQLILGNALDGSSGPPNYTPKWGYHKTWQFGAHYFFETLNTTSGAREGHAAYGKLYDCKAGDLLFTKFYAVTGKNGPVWTLEMGVVGDATRVSKLVVDKPYMGIGEHWPVPTTSWAELNYTNMCINSCWELYGATNRSLLPGTGSQYNIYVERPETLKFPWVSQWDEDEGGQKPCPASTITENHNDTVQHVSWSIWYPNSSHF
eukprot:m.218978 g.218978  ORF g.218978 m.218978 type:complete len:323 (-) comp15910_c0_seq1:51-1019(-)